MRLKLTRLLICAAFASGLFQFYKLVSIYLAAFLREPVYDLRALIGTIAVLWICWRAADWFLKENGL